MYHLPVRVADAIGRRARRMNLGDLSEFGLPIPEEGAFSRVKRLEQVPSLVDMDVIDAIRDGSIEVVATVDVLRSRQGRPRRRIRLDPDAVVLATGYLRGLEPLVGHLGVLDAKGKPVAWGARPAADGLRFIGYDVAAVAHRLYGQAVQAHGEADRPRAVSRLRYSDSSTTSGTSV